MNIMFLRGKEEICMSKFDYMNFSDGISDIEFVQMPKHTRKNRL